MGCGIRYWLRRLVGRNIALEGLTTSDENIAAGSKSPEKSSFSKGGEIRVSLTNSDDDTSLGSNAGEKSTPASKLKEGGYHGWLNVICVFLISALSWGINGSFGVYKARFIEDSKYTGGSKLTFAFIAGLAICFITFWAPGVAMFSNKYGTRNTLVFGVLLQAGGLFGASFSTDIESLFLCQSLLFGTGSCFLYVGSYGIVPQWFTKRRSLAVGLGSAGGGLGGLAWSLGAAAMIDSPGLGFGWSFRITAIIALVINLICALLVKDRNHLINVRPGVFDMGLLKRYELDLLLLWGILSMLVYTIVLFSMADYAKSVNMNNDKAAMVTALVNLGMGVGRPLIGVFSDKFGRFNIASIASVLGGLFCLCMWTYANDTPGMLYAFAFFGGVTITGTFWATIGPLTAECTGLELLPSALSIIWFTVAFPSLVAPYVALQLENHSHDRYLDVKIFCGAMELCGSFFLLLCRTRRLSLKANRAEHPDLSTEKADERYKTLPFTTRARTDVMNFLPWRFWSKSAWGKI